MLGRHVRRALTPKGKDAEIAGLKAQLSLKEVEAAKVIHRRSQVSIAEAVEAARVSELNSLKERNTALESEKSTLEGEVAALESAALSIKAASLEYKSDRLVDQVSLLEGTCSGLRDQLMGMAVHLDKEFYPRFVTTIASRRWIISRGFRLGVMKCLQSLEYVAALRMAIGLANDKGMQIGLVAGIDHEKAGRGLDELESQKDASIAYIMDSLRLEGPSPKTLEVKEGALSHCLSIFEAMGPLVDPLSSKNLVGEASTSGVPATAATTIALSVSVTTVNVSSIPPIYQWLIMKLRTFQVRRRSFPLRSLSLYAPLPSAYVTLYGPSHLGPSFPLSSAWLASLFRYTRSPGLKLVLQTLEL
ncbi:hypothetical protein Tco_1182414 [Tanacetum coccineum]